jgi:hypothetical protein
MKLKVKTSRRSLQLTPTPKGTRPVAKEEQNTQKSPIQLRTSSYAAEDFVNSSFFFVHILFIPSQNLRLLNRCWMSL